MWACLFFIEQFKFTNSNLRTITCTRKHPCVIMWQMEFSRTIIGNILARTSDVMPNFQLPHNGGKFKIPFGARAFYICNNYASIKQNRNSNSHRLTLINASKNIIACYYYLIQNALLLYTVLVQYSNLTFKCSGQELTSDSAGEPLFRVGEAVPLPDPGLRVTLCAFSPQRHG